MRRGIVIAVIVFSLLLPVTAISCDATQEPEGEAVIGPDGGILEITDENHPLYGFKIEFPENALNTSTTIQVRELDDLGELPPYVESYCSPFEVLPSGLVFNEPVIMTIPFDFGALNDTDFVYVLLFDETNNEWGRCSVISYNYIESTVTVETIHFSEGVVAKSTVDFSEAVYTYPIFDMDTAKYPIDQRGGECKGISVYTTWYFKEVGQGLRNAYCDANYADDLAEYADQTLFFNYAFWGPHDRSAVAKDLWLGLKNDKCPQLLNLRLSTDDNDVHMVVVYNYDGQYFNVHNSNYLYYKSENPQRIEVIDGELTDYVYFEGPLSGKQFYDLFRYETLGFIIDWLMMGTYEVFPPDSDCDYIPDDGNKNLEFGDKPCMTGEYLDCDDNCPCLYNPDQTDSDADGMGDVCDADYEDLVDGVSEVISPGVPGPVKAEVPNNWVPIVTGDENAACGGDTSGDKTFMMARTYEDGRVVIMGHDGLIETLDQLSNEQLVLNIVSWLDASNGKRVVFSTGHDEWVTASDLDPLKAELESRGYSFEAATAPISSNFLADRDVLIFGNAWGTISSSEIDAVESFVANGGGLFLIGVGWSWGHYHPEPIEEYPMMQLALPYGVKWLECYLWDIYDDQTPVFNVFYPDIPGC